MATTGVPAGEALGFSAGYSGSAIRGLLRTVFLTFAILAAEALSLRADELPALHADLSQTSVSGLSSGGYMAGQFHVAHSATVIGAGIIAAGPFGCAQTSVGEFQFFPLAVGYNLAQAENGCMADRLSAFGVLDSQRLSQAASALAGDGKIDALSNLKRSKVYLYSGEDDHTVAKQVVEAARDFYLAAGVPASNIVLISNKPGGHAFLSASAGTRCGLSDPPYVNNCHYDQAQAILRFIYGTLEAKGTARPENFLSFDQTAYSSSSATLAGQGIVYVPSACRTDRCRVHIVFHGCKQSRADVQDAFIRGPGFADWADTNKIVVLFPQAASSALNPETCWDWWGYTGLGYLTKEAPQIKAVFAMLSHLGGGH